MLNRRKMSLGASGIRLTDALFFVVTTIGMVFTAAGIFIIIDAAAMSPQTQGISQFQHSLLSVMGSIPGFPINTSDLYDVSLNNTGMVSWIVGLCLLVTGPGLWAKKKPAKWVATMIFSLSAWFHFLQFILLGLVGAPAAAAVACADILILYSLVKVKPD